MDQLEKIIIGIKDEIENEEPHQGHFERFEMKLNNLPKNKTKHWIGYATSFAAIVLICLFLFAPKRQVQKLTLSDLSPQYADVEYYYTSTINKQTTKLVNLNSLTGGDQSIQMLIEEIENYDKMYDQLCNDLNATPNDERVINALITYYQTKLEIINKILNEIEKQQENINNHENISI